MDKKEVIKLIQDLIKRDICIKGKEVRVAKHLNAVFLEFDKLEKAFKNIKKVYDSLQNAKNENENRIQEMKEAEEEQKINMIRLKQEKKSLIKKISLKEKSLHNVNSVISSVDTEIAYKKQFRKQYMKIATSTHINENTPENIVQVVAANNFHKDLSPSEITWNKSTEDKTGQLEQLWDICHETSPYTNEWQKLFSI